MNEVMEKLRILIISALFIIFLSLGFLFTAYAEDNLILTTYYPSPYGVFRELRSKRMSLGDNYYAASGYCWAPDSCTYQIDSNADLVVEGNVGIGYTSPGSKLVIKGDGSTSSTSSLNVVNSSYTSILFARDDGNLGIATTSPSSTFSVGNNSQFRVNSSGNLIRINNVAYSWTGTAATGTSILSNDGSGNLIWVASSGFGPSSGWTDDGSVVRLTTDTDSVGIGTTSPGVYKLYVEGDAYFNKIVTAASTQAHGVGHNLNDIAEDILADACEPADVVVIDQNTTEKVIKSSKPYDQRVAGVISQGPALYIGKKNQEEYKPLVLKGRVYCKVSLENGPIKRGDFLTTSSIPGHAMKAADRRRASGAILGKALASFSGGWLKANKTGKITVLVTLQ